MYNTAIGPFAGHLREKHKLRDVSAIMKKKQRDPNQSTLTLTNVSAKLSPAQSKRVDEALLEFLGKDAMPPSMVNGVGFKKFVSVLQPSYKIPTRQTLSKWLKEKATEVRPWYFTSLIFGYFSLTHS